MIIPVPPNINLNSNGIAWSDPMTITIDTALDKTIINGKTLDTTPASFAASTYKWHSRALQVSRR